MNSPKNWDLQIDPSVHKELKKIPRQHAEAILQVAHLLPQNPYFGDIKKMKGTDHAWRRRVGEYRLFYKVEIDQHAILVFHIERRTSKTY